MRELRIRTPDGKELPAFGEGLADDIGQRSGAPAIAVTMRDIRCGMINLDPDAADNSPAMLKTVVRINDNNAGVYAAVTRTGRLEVGQMIHLSTSTN